MIVVAGTMRLAPEDLAALGEIARETVLATRREAGCVTYSFAEDLAEPGVVRIYEEWESRATLEAHGRSDHIAEWRAAVSKITVQSRELKTAEIDDFAPMR